MIFVKKIVRILVVLILFVLPGCNSVDVNPFISKEVKEGYRLARQYCKSCHTFPEPRLLNKKTWAMYVLPKMGRLIGFQKLGTGGYVESGKEVMKLDQWNKLVKYYVSQSPENPILVTKSKIRQDIKNFNVILPAFTVKRPVTTMVHIDPEKQRIYFGDGLSGKIYILSKDYRFIDSFPVNEGVSGLFTGNGSMMALSMGVLHPSDEKKGKLEVINPDTKKGYTLIDSLQRPVHALYVDLNQDGKQDIIVSEFGNQTGMLSWFENLNEMRFTKHILRTLPGAVQTQVHDFNNDGRPDIIAMMAQGDEGIFIYYNEGNGLFQEKRILQFPPSYGSNYFELGDFNKDGSPDIIATNGDNGDYPPILKAYHGIRIYLNNGNNQFRQELFLPVNGVGKAIARDFDSDGDLDIASIAYFPDYDRHPEEGFIYWENKGGLSFEPHTIKAVSSGRWLTMDAGDIDADGDLDIVLGNTFFPLGYVPEYLKKKWELYTPSILVLKNNLH